MTATAYVAGTVYLPRFTRMLREGRGDEVMELWHQVTLKISNLVVPSVEKNWPAEGSQIGVIASALRIV
ncbi:hypothetical protein C2W62_21155 [Candidatus Entotheonella serta]|nr:hypothetical protein C2W62_21155 [Candidatus Entotheonella serta]